MQNTLKNTMNAKVRQVNFFINRIITILSKRIEMEITTVLVFFLAISQSLLEFCLQCWEERDVHTVNISMGYIN